MHKATQLGSGRAREKPWLLALEPGLWFPEWICLPHANTTQERQHTLRSCETFTSLKNTTHSRFSHQLQHSFKMLTLKWQRCRLFLFFCHIKSRPVIFFFHFNSKSWNIRLFLKSLTLPNVGIFTKHRSISVPVSTCAQNHESATPGLSPLPSYPLCDPNCASVFFPSHLPIIPWRIYTSVFTF
jgi:hypothetical protein